MQLGNGDGTFAAGVNYPSQSPVGLASGEFNGDGKADFAVANSGSVSGSLSIFLGSIALSTTTTLTSSPNPANFGQSVTLTATVTPASATGYVAFYDGVTLLGAGILVNGQASLATLALPSGSRSLKALYSGDASNLASGSGTIYQLVGAAATPSSGFQPPLNYSAGLEPLSVATGDFNGDGKADIAMANFGGVDGGSSVRVMLGNGDGAFQPPVDYTAGSGVSAVAVGDLNADGKVDLVATNYSDNTVSVLLGNGDGTFQPAVSFAVGKNPISVAIGDFNRDGYPDLRCTQFQHHHRQSQRAAGERRRYLPEGRELPLFLRVYRVAAADLYGNGILDLAVGTYSGVAILRGNGDGTFGHPKLCRRRCHLQHRAR